MLARPPVNAGLLLLLLCAMQKARSVAGFAWREDFAAPLRGSPRQSFALPVSLLPLLPTARAMLARPPVNAGLLLLLLCAMQKARSVAGFAWREDFAAPLRGSPRQSFALPVSLLPLLPTARAMLARPPVNAGLLLPLLCATQKARSVAGFAWRREEDSNLRTSHPRHTISNRAP